MATNVGRRTKKTTEIRINGNYDPEELERTIGSAMRGNLENFGNSNLGSSPARSSNRSVNRSHHYEKSSIVGGDPITNSHSNVSNMMEGMLRPNTSDDLGFHKPSPRSSRHLQTTQILSSNNLSPSRPVYDENGARMHYGKIHRFSPNRFVSSSKMGSGEPITQPEGYNAPSGRTSTSFINPVRTHSARSQVEDLLNGSNTHNFEGTSQLNFTLPGGTTSNMNTSHNMQRSGFRDGGVVSYTPNPRFDYDATTSYGGTSGYGRGGFNTSSLLMNPTQSNLGIEVINLPAHPNLEEKQFQFKKLDDEKEINESMMRMGENLLQVAKDQIRNLHRIKRGYRGSPMKTRPQNKAILEQVKNEKSKLNQLHGIDLNGIDTKVSSPFNIQSMTSPMKDMSTLSKKLDFTNSTAGKRDRERRAGRETEPRKKEETYEYSYSKRKETREDDEDEEKDKEEEDSSRGRYGRDRDRSRNSRAQREQKKEEEEEQDRNKKAEEKEEEEEETSGSRNWRNRRSRAGRQEDTKKNDDQDRDEDKKEEHESSSTTTRSWRTRRSRGGRDSFKKKDSQEEDQEAEPSNSGSRSRYTRKTESSMVRGSSKDAAPKEESRRTSKYSYRNSIQEKEDEGDAKPEYEMQGKTRFRSKAKDSSERGSIKPEENSYQKLTSSRIEIGDDGEEMIVKDTEETENINHSSFGDSGVQGSRSRKKTTTRTTKESSGNQSYPWENKKFRFQNDKELSQQWDSLTKEQAIINKKNDQPRPPQGVQVLVLQEQGQQKEHEQGRLRDGVARPPRLLLCGGLLGPISPHAEAERPRGGKQALPLPEQDPAALGGRAQQERRPLLHPRQEGEG